MIFQFIFTVCGGGLLIAGLIMGFSLGWDISGDDNTARIALIFAIFGAVLFFVGVVIAVFLYKAVSAGNAGEDKKEQKSE